MPTKPTLRLEAQTDEERIAVAGIVNQIASLAQHQQAGFVLSLDELAPLEYELLKSWHAEVAALERANQRNAHAELIGLLSAVLRVR